MKSVLGIAAANLRVRASIGHREHIRPDVLGRLQVLVLELLAVDRLATGTLYSVSQSLSEFICVMPKIKLGIVHCLE